MRILYTAFDVVPSPKGASVHITHVIRALVGAGHDVHLITPGDGILPASDVYEGAIVTRIPRGNDMNFLVRATAFGEAVQAHIATQPGYDIVHFRSVWDGVHIVQARQHASYRTLFEVNGLPGIELPYHYPNLHDTPLLLRIREQELATLVLSDALVCPSDVTRAYLMSLGIPRERITVIRNGYSPSAFCPPAPAVQDTRGEHDDMVPTILYIGTFADWQGLETLIDAMPVVHAACPARLHIIGRGRKRQRKLLEKRIRTLGLAESVCVATAVPHHDIPAIVATAAVCVAPLALNDRNVVQGCCPIKVIEYMGAGRPIVAANLPVVRELVREDRDALLFTPGDAAGLARQIIRILNDPALAQRLATNAAERAQAELTWHHAEKKLVRLYERLRAG